MGSLIAVFDLVKNDGEPYALLQFLKLIAEVQN